MHVYTHTYLHPVLGQPRRQGVAKRGRRLRVGGLPAPVSGRQRGLEELGGQPLAADEDGLWCYMWGLMYVWGGHDMTRRYTDTYVCDLSTLKWCMTLEASVALSEGGGGCPWPSSVASASGAVL